MFIALVDGVEGASDIRDIRRNACVSTLSTSREKSLKLLGRDFESPDPSFDETRLLVLECLLKL